MAASIKLSTVSFSSLQPCSSIRQPLMPIKIGCTKSIVLVSQKKKQNGTQSRLQRHLKVKALDAAQPFDYESKRINEIENNSKLKIGIVGFGNFGQFLAKTIVGQGHTVLAHSRRDYSEVAQKMGVSFYMDQDDFCEEHPEVILLCSSIISTESVLRLLPTQRLKRNTLFVDVLSVKEFPRNLFLQVLPSEFDILCTHPMFGPESGKAGWSGLPLVYDKVRIGQGLRAERCQQFLNIFAKEGCRMVEMSCAEHDRHAAETQFITHTVGRMLGNLNLESTPINTKGYESLLRIVENTAGDSFDLYYGLFMYNVNATEQLERLEMAFDALKKQLVGRLHKILRTQLFDGVARGEVSEQSSSLADPQNPTSDTTIPLRTK
ncbi:arogenate dehydrogenase 2, chloroplastic [Cryptomeria japonica]|uniref:arogenate dehydrogenase 2, chloroplastic n=1 Tax=Cryptomeria japonica TaxID=3369 RepID=UPI0025AB891E|nr:arogenate dehydrogenase 2, chloroplastic [Cryptomeria japonica]XP_057855874.1 arogenate dehydrogenase 2, chloroplastic [Cryptomeria japonica]